MNNIASSFEKVGNFLDDLEGSNFKIFCVFVCVYISIKS